MRYSHRGTRKHNKGFTLIEIIVGMVTLSISLAVVINMIVPAERESADKIHQIKAAELGQAMLDEILGRAFDHQSDHAGGVGRCDETGRSACTAAGNFGTEAGETDRTLYNDVDDYHGFSGLVTPTNNTLDSGYSEFEISVAVSYSGTSLGLTNTLAKLVVVTITTPLGDTIEFAGFKSNF